MSAGPDFCTVTLSKDAGRSLQAVTALDEPGTARQGFKSSERRACLGGFVWRRWDPVTPSNAFGTDYESWETEAEASRWLMHAALPLESRASRQDYAFDFCVLPDLMPRDLLPVFRPHLAEIGIEPHFAGPESSCTVYLGSRQSDRRVKIYRRDLKDPALLHDGFPPLIRIELELRGLPCHGLWHHRQATGEDGLAIACTHIAALTGYRVSEDSAPLPDPVEASAESDAAQMVFEFVQQNASMLDACRRAGIDLGRLARSRVSSFSRMTEYRHQTRCSRLASADASAIERLVLMRLGSPAPELGEAL